MVHTNNVLLAFHCHRYDHRRRSLYFCPNNDSWIGKKLFGYEQKLHERLLYLAQPLFPCVTFCHYLIKPSLLLGNGRLF